MSGEVFSALQSCRDASAVEILCKLLDLRGCGLPQLFCSNMLILLPIHIDWEAWLMTYHHSLPPYSLTVWTYSGEVLLVWFLTFGLQFQWNSGWGELIRGGQLLWNFCIIFVWNAIVDVIVKKKTKQRFPSRKCYTLHPHCTLSLYSCNNVIIVSEAKLHACLNGLGGKVPIEEWQVMSKDNKFCHN